MAQSLSDQQRYVITFIEQQFALTAAIPSVDVISENFIDIDPGEIAIWFKSSVFRDALDRRGVPINSLTLARPVGSLTPEQLLVANTMLDFRDNRSDKKKLADLDVSTQTYNMWLKDPGFQSYIKTRSEQVLNESSHEVNLALLNRARSGDTNAMRLYYGYTGKYSERAENNSGVDIAYVLVRVLEIIQRYVPDESALLAIGNEFQALTNGGAAAPALRTGGTGPIIGS